MDKLLEDEMLEEVSGGKILMQHTNFCPRCRSAAYIVLHEDKGIQHRTCKNCQLEYDYRKW